MAINLLPWREQRATRRVQQSGLLLAAGIVVISVLTVGLHYFLNFLQKDYQSRNNHLTQEINSIHLSGNSQKLSADYQIATQKIKIIQTIRLNQINFWREFAFLQKNLPDDMQLTHFDWMNDELRLQGTTTQSEHIGLLVKSLELSQFFSSIFLESIDKEDTETLIHFTIRARRIQEPVT